MVRTPTHLRPIRTLALTGFLFYSIAALGFCTELLTASSTHSLPFD